MKAITDKYYENILPQSTGPVFVDNLTYFLRYNKTCVKRPPKNRQSKWYLNEDGKYCRMLQAEHSAILLTYIKRYLVLKTNLWSFEIGRQASKIALVRSYLRVPQAAGQVKILIFLV